MDADRFSGGSGEAVIGGHDPLGVAGDFPHAAGYLDTASLGLPPATAVAALHAAVDEWQRGAAGAVAYDRFVDGSRAAFARLVGVPAERVAVGGQVSSFTGLLAASLPTGARVVVPEGEFTSVLFPFLARDDLDVRTVPFRALAEHLDADVDAVAFAAVQSADGSVADLDAIEQAAADHDVITFVDVTQSAGWLPVDASRFDYVTAGAYKWLLSPRGTAFLAIAERRQDELRPVHASWYGGADRWDSIYGAPLRLADDARRFDLSPAWLPWVGTLPALELLLEVGVERIRTHDVCLANRLLSGLDRPAGDSAIVALDVGDVDLTGLTASRRAGRLRVGFHLYSTDADVDLLLDRLAG